MRILSFILIYFVPGFYANSQVIPYIGGTGSGYKESMSPQTICSSFFGNSGDGYDSESAGCAIIVPIKEIKFSGEKESNRNILRWQITGDFKLKETVIERGVDGIAFKPLVSILPNTGQNHLYFYVDNAPPPGINFYRLKVFEYNNNFSYSRIIDLKNWQQLLITLYPNPGHDICNIEYYSEKKQVIHVQLIQPDGVIIVTQDLILSTGNNKLKFSLKNIVNGMYLLRVVETGESVKLAIFN